MGIVVPLLPLGVCGLRQCMLSVGLINMFFPWFTAPASLEGSLQDGNAAVLAGSETPANNARHYAAPNTLPAAPAHMC